MIFEQTTLQIIEFGEEPEDQFYCLVDKRMSPDGMDIKKLSLTDPRNFDAAFRDSGCLIMLTGDEVGSLTGRGDLDEDRFHESLFELAVREGVIKKAGS